VSSLFPGVVLSVSDNNVLRSRLIHFSSVGFTPKNFKTEEFYCGKLLRFNPLDVFLNLQKRKYFSEINNAAN
jgi:hypothetical protein